MTAVGNSAPSSESSEQPGSPPPAPARKPGESRAVWLVAASAIGACVLTGVGAATMAPGLIGRLFPHHHEHESTAIGTLRTITTAQALFREGDMDRDNTLDYAASLRDLHKANLIDTAMGSGTRDGYTFRITAADQFTWSARADPVRPEMWTRNFFVDETGVIRFSTTKTATSSDTAIGG